MSCEEEFEIKTEPIDIKEEWQIDLNQPNVKKENETKDNFAPEDLNFVKCEPHEFIAPQDTMAKDPLELGMKYKCDLCNKSYPRKSALSRHIKTVHEGKRFECKTCNQVFTQSGSLKTHQLEVHDGIKKYECKNCNQHFTKSTHLKTHQSAVHEGKKFEC